MSGTRLEQMPKGEEEVRILRQRAALLRKGDAAAPLATAVPYVRFRMGAKEWFGIPHGYVAEVFSPAEITPLPWVPPVIAGVLNRRGALLPAVDLRAFFRVAEAKEACEPAVIIVAAAGLTVGILADAIEGEDQFRPGQLAEAVQSGGIAKMGHVLGIHAGATTILNVEAVLGDVARAVEGARTKPFAPHPSPAGDER